MCITLVLFIVILILKSLTINDFKNIAFSSIQLMEKISFALAAFSIFKKSNKHLNVRKELKFRLTSFSIYIFYAFCFRVASIFIFD